MKPSAHSAAPTINDVAREAGVSAMTVSRALRNAPGCGQRTRQSVLDAAKRLGYKRSPLVSAYQAHIRSRRLSGFQATIGWLNDYPDRGFWARAPGYYSGVWRGASARAADLGFALEEIWIPIPEGAKPVEQMIPRLRRQMLAKGIPGLIIPPGRFPQCDFADWPGLAVVCGALGREFIDHPGTSCRYHSVLADFYSNALTACIVLAQNGCRRIGFHLPGYVDNQTQWRYRGGFLAWQAGLPASWRVPLLTADFPLFDELPSGFAKWMERHKPDGLICMKSETLGWVRRLGLRTPQDVQVAHLWLAEDVAGWSGIDPDLDKIGAAMVDQLAGQLYRNERFAPPHPQLIQIAGTWRDGKTSRADGDRTRKR